MSSYHNSPDYPNYASSEDERMKQILDHDAHLAQRQRLHDVDMNKTNTKNFVRMASSGGSSVSGKSGSSGMSGSTTVAHGNLQNYFHKKNSKAANSESEREDQFDDGWSFASSALSSRLSRFSSSHRSKKSTASSAASSSVASSSASSTDRWVNRNFDDSRSVQSRGNNSTNYLDFPKDDDDADDEHSTTAHEHSTASGIARNGILSFIANNCLPPQLLSSSKIAHKRSSNHRSFNKNNNTNLIIYTNSTNSNSKNNKSRSNNILPFLLLSLILYGTISMIVDVYHSIAQSSLLDFKNSQSKKGTSNDEFLTREQDNQRFPGGFGSVDGSSSASYNNENGNYYGGYGGANSITSSSNTGMGNVDANLRGNEKNVKSASLSSSFIPGVRSMDVIQSTSQSLSKQQQQQQPHGGVGGDSLTYAPASDFSNQQQQQQQQQQNVINGIQNINRNYPTLADVPILTEHILSTTFQHALEYNHHNPHHQQQQQQQNYDRNNNINAPYPNEILFFWYVGGTPGLGPFHKVAEKFQQCFPNVVQAAGMSEEESRSFPNELRILQHQIPLGNARETKNNHHPTSTRKGGKYLNVDLFSPEGVRRAADLEMLFPMQPFPVAYEHEDETMAMAMAVEQQMMEQQRKQLQQYRTMMEQEDANGENAIMASSQVQFMISPFLPEASMGLFTPPSSSSATPQTSDNSAIETNTPPKARIHGVFLPTNMRIGLYYKHYTSTHLNHGYSSFLQFVTSPTSIVVNNYMTRILSGQWEEGSPVTEVHLEIAKNVVSRKVTLWPNRGMEDMQLHWIHWYGWQDGAMGFYQQLLEDVSRGTDGDGGGVRKEDVEEMQKLVLGMDCLFPPPEPVVATGENGALDENGQVISNGVEDGGESQQQSEAARSARPKHQPNELEREINKIIAERNTLDQELFSYVVELYNSRVKS